MRISLDEKALAYVNELLDSYGLSEYGDTAFNAYLGDENKYLTTSFSYNLSPYFDDDKESIDALGFSTPTLIEASLITDNPYFKILSKLNVPFSTYKANELFLLDEKDVLPNGLEVTPLGYFSKDVTFPLINKNGRTWMSIIPHEINTMKEAIDEASGNVLTYGLGLGYFAYMAATKDNVTSVTVIEIDQEIISFYEKNIHPYLPNKNKIRVIKGDAFLFGEGEHYDYLFIDTYHDEKDGLNHLSRFLKTKLPSDKVTYWIKDTILVYLRRYVLSLLEEEANGLDEKELNKGDNVFRKLHSLLKEKKIETKSDIKNLLSKENLLDLASRL